ncbi:MAG: gamma carbonic anhydrase family protein, partial [Sinobacteraceae bacterium]|nr:gamma carbonic anhydrase family protein [Nevskiaceae bacterium]
DASIIGDVVLGIDTSVWFGATLRGDNARISLGARSNIQDGSVVHVDEGYPVTIGNGVVVGHRVIIHGCTIGDNSLIGMGSVLLNGCRIGRNCLVGANALITEGKEFPDNSVILGAPAKFVRPVDAEVEAIIREAAEHYVSKVARYARELRRIDAW